jgi:hypothetical protein
MLRIKKRLSNTNRFLEAFINFILQITIAVAVALAVVMIIWGGLERMTKDSVIQIGDGKKRIQSAIMGLLLALSTYMILYIINPALTRVSLNVKDVKITGDGANAEIKNPGGTPGSETDGTDTGGTPGGDTPPGGGLPGLAEYESQGNQTTDRGTISPKIAYLRDKIPEMFPALVVTSTRRNGGGRSLHDTGNAIDLGAKSGNENDPAFIAQGKQLVQWSLQNAASLGLHEVFFKDEGYDKPAGQPNFNSIGAVPNHNNHVHIGLFAQTGN